MENTEIGILAGKIWSHLSEKGPSDAPQIKFSLNISNSQLYLALGWLAREGKIAVVKEKNTHRISLVKSAG